jgi:hypothetical protein
MAIDNWEKVLAAAGERVTIRVPRMFREQMEVRARIAGRSLNEEYGRAIEAWCGGGEGWTQILLPADDIHAGVTTDVVLRQQLGTVLVDALELEGKYIGLRVAGYAITLDRGWFVTDEGLEKVRGFLAKQLPLLIQIGEGWGPGRPGQPEPTLFTYGRIGDLCRKLGCKAGAAESVMLTHTDIHGKQVTIDVPLCSTHAAETRTAIAAGLAPKFSVE